MKGQNRGKKQVFGKSIVVTNADKKGGKCKQKRRGQEHSSEGTNGKGNSPKGRTSGWEKKGCPGGKKKTQNVNFGKGKEHGGN